MAELRVTSTVTAQGDVLTGLIARLMDAEPGMAEAGAVLESGVDEAFEAGDRGGWAALARQTIQERTQAGYGGEHPILIRSGSYLASFQQKERSSLEVTVGSDDSRFNLLNYGGQSDDGFLVPGRPVVLLQSFVDAAADAVWSWLIEDTE